MPHIRPYSPQDREGCLAIFDSNCPEFMHPDERAEFEAWLEAPNGSYLVLEVEREIVGCGGFVVEAEDERLTLTWGLVHGDCHGRRWGDLLLLERLVRGQAEGGANHSQLGTAPRTEAFFARVGYRTIARVPDGWVPGLDRVDMRLDFGPEVAADLRHQLEELRLRLGVGVGSSSTTPRATNSSGEV